MTKFLSNYLCSLMSYCAHYFEGVEEYSIAVDGRYIVVTVLKDERVFEKVISKAHATHLRECLVDMDIKAVFEAMLKEINEGIYE